jgi:integrase
LLIFIRSSELRFARWSEIDFETAMWTIPAEREAIEGVSVLNVARKCVHPDGTAIWPGVSNPEVNKISGDRDFVFVGDHNPRKPMGENTVNKALRVMGYDTKVEVCGHDWTMACGSLIESGLWSRDAVERQMSHMERNSVRAAYIHKAEHLDEKS